MTDEEFIQYMKDNYTNSLVRNNKGNVCRLAQLWKLFL